MELDEWQQFVLRGALLERPDGRWAAKEVGLEVPRQNGKGELLEARGLIGLFLLDNERRLIHSAHEFATASEALDRMDDRIAANPKLAALCKPTKRSHGEEGIYRKDGRKLRYRTRTKGGGRGFSADWLALDEAMFLAEAFHGALMPTVSARWNPQIWYAGSAVDQATMEHGIVFARVRDRAMQGEDDRLAYFGWSPAFDRPDDVPLEAAADPDVWAQGNPTLGIRIFGEHIALENRSMDHRTFCVERLGVGDWPKVRVGDDWSDSVIDREKWAACLDADSAIPGAVHFAFDVRPDRGAAAISVSGRNAEGFDHVETVEHRAGTHWVPSRLAELVKTHGGEVACDDKGPAGALLQDLKDLGVKVRTVTAAQHAQGCGMIFDAIDNTTLRHLGQPELDAAARGAARRRLAGESWLWSRTGSNVDITPLVSSTLALFCSRTGGRSRTVVVH